MFGLIKVLGLDFTMNASGGLYIKMLNIQDPHTNVGYDFFTYRINHIHDEIVAAKEGRMENFKFHH